MSHISTHILNLGDGTPAAGIEVELTCKEDDSISRTGISNADGRIKWHQPITLTPGTWQLEFKTSNWFSKRQEACFFNNVTLSFNITDVTRSYHIPLLLNAFGYSTYRGS